MSYKTTRELIKEAYPYKRWWAKVDKMTAEQVIATFLRLRKKGVV